MSPIVRTEPRSAASGERQQGARPIGSKCRPDCVSPTPAQAHCSVCHRTFGAVGGFDRHRRDGWCVDPVKLGMVERDGVWRTPMDPERAEQLRASREAVEVAE